MRGARPRSRHVEDAGERAHAEARRVAGSEAELEALEEQEDEEALLRDLAAHVQQQEQQHPYQQQEQQEQEQQQQQQQQPSPVFEVAQPVQKSSPRESSALARARARARPEAATGQPLWQAQAQGDSNVVPTRAPAPVAEPTAAPAPAPPPVAAPVRSGGRPTVNSLHAVAGRSGVTYTPKTPSHVPGERSGYMPSPAAASGSLPVPKLLAQTSGFRVPPSPSAPEMGKAPFSPDALDQFANNAHAPPGNSGAPPPQQLDSHAFARQHQMNPAAYGVAAPQQHWQPAQEQPQPQQPMYLPQPANEWSGYPAGSAAVEYAPTFPARFEVQQHPIHHGYATEEQHSPGGRRRAAREHSQPGYSTKLEFAPTEVNKGSAPAAVFGGWNHYGAPPGPLQQGLHPEPKPQQHGGPHQQVAPQVDMYVHHPGPEAPLYPPMGDGSDSPPLGPEEDIVTQKICDRRREKLRQSAPLRMGDQQRDGEGQAPFSAGGEKNQERRSHTAGAQPTRGASRCGDNGNHNSGTIVPRPGGNFYKSGYAKAAQTGQSAGPVLGTRGAYTPGTLREFKENDSGYKTRGGLGADLDNPELRAKQERAARAKEYARAAQERAGLLAKHGGKIARIGERKEGPQSEPGRRRPGRGAEIDGAPRLADDRHGGRQEWGKPNDELERQRAARQKAKEYAARVPKPKPRRLAVANPSSPAGTSAHHGLAASVNGQSQPSIGSGRRMREEREDADVSTGGGLPGYIDGLESAHRQHQAAVARIKQELLR